MFDHLLTGSPLDFRVSNLHPQMLELMCDQYLRTDVCPAEFRIEYALVKTGKTIAVIDLYAFTKSQRYICMQITHSTDLLTVKRKAEKLKQYVAEIRARKNIITVLAVPSVHRHLIAAMGLHFLSIEEIFDLLASRAEYKRMLKELIGITNLDYR